MQASHSVIIDGDERALHLLPILIEQVIHELEEKSHLTISVNDVTIERNPHGRGMWNYVVKVNSNETQ